MASSMRKAQLLLSCQLCDNTVVLRWKCEDCQLLMCEKCKISIHPRFKSVDKHSVILIKDVGKGKQAVVGKELEDVSRKFASLEIAQSQKVNRKVIRSVLNTYKTIWPVVNKIVCCDDGTIFMSNNEVKQVIGAKLLPASMKILQTFDSDLYDITVTQVNDILVSPRSSEMRVLSRNSEMKTVFDVSPLRLLAVHFDKEFNEIVIGVRDSGPMYEVSDFSTRQLIILGKDFKRKRTFEFDDVGKRFFTYPARITTDVNGTIYVVDGLDDKFKGRIVVINREGDLKFTYSGYQNFQNSPFTPMDVAVTKSKNLVIADKDNHLLHLIKPDGLLVGLQNTLDVGIIHPYSLCVDSEGFLLIGCNNCQSERKGAEIHVVKLSVEKLTLD